MEPFSAVVSKSVFLVQAGYYIDSHAVRKYTDTLARTKNTKYFCSLA